MESEIRDFRPDDYPTCVRISNVTYPDHVETVEDWKYYDEHRDPRTTFRRWVATAQGEVVGWGQYEQNPWMFHPRKFFVHGQVLPDHAHLGIGSGLYDAILAGLVERDPLMVRASVRESSPDGLRFLLGRGFYEERRAWESELDLATFDPTTFAGSVQKVINQGIEIRSIKELMTTDPEWKRHLHDVEVEAGRDVPRPDEYTPISFEFFEKEILRDPTFMPEAGFIALHEGRYVGMSQLWAKRGEAKLGIGLTGVLPEYRGRGIATALKLRGIEFAKAHGAPAITTGNDTLNEPILAINVKMGFKRRPVWINLAKRLKAE